MYCAVLCDSHVVLGVKVVLASIHADICKRIFCGLLSHACLVFRGQRTFCKLSLIVNRTAAKVQKEKMNKDVKSGPARVQSALDMTDSDDEP